MQKELIKPDQLSQTLAEVGFDLETEVMQIETSSNGIDLPRIRIEHKDNGRHRLFIDYGENYLDDDSQEIPVEGNTLEGVVFAEQYIRALWEEGEALPKCSAIDNIPIVNEPLHPQCAGCPESIIGEGKCKPKIRLWILVETGEGIKPFILALSPTSIKHWNQHLKKLKRSQLPVVAVKTVFGLEDIKKNGYRWAEVHIDVSGVADKETLLMAKEYRDELKRLMSEVSEKDFEDPGDKVGE